MKTPEEHKLLYMRTCSTRVSKIGLQSLQSSKIAWVARFSQLTLEENDASATSQRTQGTGHSTLSQGWALHKLRSSKRFSKEVKDYLLAKYNLGEKTGSKCDPQNVAEEMRKTKHVDGKRRFRREDWLTTLQIKGFFSRITAARRKQGNRQETVFSNQDNDDDLDAELLDDIAEMEDSDERDELKSIIQGEIALQHPIIYDTYNLCEMYNRMELKKYNVKMLKQICSDFEIQIKSRDVKMTVIEKLSAELSKCTCNQ